MNRLFFYFLFLSILLSSCIKFVDRELDIPQKLVVYCYISPQLDTTFLHLTHTSLLFTRNPRKIEVVTNATVEFSNDNLQWVKMEFDAEHELYFLPQAQLKIQEGKTYYIRASAPDYETASSSCTVPYLRETNLEVAVEESINDVHDRETFSQLHEHWYFKWQDYAGEENYYIFLRNYAFWLYEYEYDYETWPPTEIPIDSTFYHSWGYFWRDNHKPCVFSDKGQDGKKMSELLIVYYTKKEFDQVTLLQTDKNCYMFEASLFDYDGTMQTLMLEPNQLYTNIKNGYGVFGAFVKKEYSFEFEEEK
jgi:hypothetical protein